jgi:signal transduction histidine kinase/CheY-like chemotaxis protein
LRPQQLEVFDNCTVRISSQLKAISYVTAVAFIIMIPVFVGAFLEFKQTKSNYVLAESINRNLLKDSSLRNQYFLYYNPYVLEQLDTQERANDALLELARSQFSREDDQQLLQQTPEYIRKIKAIFGRVVKNHSLMVAGNIEQRPIYAELEKRLVSQLLLKVSEVEQTLQSLLNNAALRIQEDFENLVIVSILFTVFSATAIIVVMTLLGRLISRKLAYLHEGAGIVASGDLNFRLQDVGRDEFAELARSINFVTANLQSFTQKLESEIHVRKKTEEDLIEAKISAELANKAKSDFLSSMSHELRTPLNSILGFSQLLDGDPDQPLSDDQQDSLFHINNSGRYLLELINNVRDLSKIEAGQVHLNIEEVFLPEIIEESLQSVLTKAEEHGINISIADTSEIAPMVQADRVRLLQVMINLLSNAIKYNRENGEVTIVVEETARNMLHVAVRDTGDGIPENRQGELFKSFGRLGAENSSIEGTGIGLVICKDLIERMDGTIGLESEVGKGSTFWFELPVAKENVEAPAVKITEQEIQEKVLPSGANGTLLYVEDNPANLLLMEKVISRIEGLSLISAPSGERGIELAKASRPDLIILDINLPGMSGIEVLQQLRKSDETANTPILALSAAATKTNIEEGLAAGFDQYLTKPVDISETVNVINALLVENR